MAADAHRRARRMPLSEGGAWAVLTVGGADQPARFRHKIDYASGVVYRQKERTSPGHPRTTKERKEETTSECNPCEY